MSEQGKIPCHQCNGTGSVTCDCPDHHQLTVSGHPLNVTDYQGVCKVTW
jgi:hypothetical protein